MQIVFVFQVCATSSAEGKEGAEAADEVPWTETSCIVTTVLCGVKLKLEL